MKNVSTIYLFSQFLLNFPSMPFSSDFRMLIPQQSSTTPVRPAESINTKTEVFFMRELRNTKIIAVDHGYGAVRGVGGIDSWQSDVEDEYHISAEEDIRYSFTIC